MLFAGAGGGLIVATVAGGAARNGAGAGATGVARLGGRDSGALDGVVVNAGARTGLVCGRAGVGIAWGSAGRVTVPFRLKSLSSLGPIVSFAGVLVVGAGAAWPNTATGPRPNAAAAKVLAPRKIALIRSRS